ncbi:hypothetical protein TNCV_1653981 [Trichonephila clavipes]|nr:hypothetical protein TNCV_1653981 [Trichonephila clavipes]
MLIYELPASSLKCRAQPNVIRRSFEPHDQMLYHRTILEPHTAYPIPAGTHYIVLTVQKTAFDSRCPRTCADSCPEPVQISDVPQSPVQIPDVPPSPVHIPQPPVQIPDVLEPPPPVQIPKCQIQMSQNHLCRFHLVQIPDVPEPVQIPMSQVPQPPMQILPEPMNILHVSEPVQIPDGSRTCADSSVTRPTATYADSPRTYEHSTCIRTCADSKPPVPEPVQIPVSQVPQPPMQILHVSEPVQIPVSQVPQSPVQSLPEPMQLLPELDILDPLESTDAFDQLMSFVFGPQELQLLYTVPSIFDENFFSFLDEFEREPMDLTMPRLNSCVKNIGFKPIQPMDLSVNSSIGQ